MKETAKTDLYYLHVIIGLCFIFGVGHIPPVEPITEIGMQILGIFFGLIYLWSTCGAIWPSLIGIIALGMSDYCSMADAIKNGIGNTTFWQLLTVVILAAAISQSGCGEVIARWMITRKMVAGKPLLFIFIFLMTFFLAAIFLGATPMILFGWTLCYSIANQLNCQKGDATILSLLFGVHISCMIGTNVLPFKGVRIAICAAFEKAAGFQIGYVQYMVLALLIGFLFIAIYTFSIKYLFRVDLSKLRDVDLEHLREGIRSLTFHEKAYMAGFAAAILYILLVTILPSQWGITKMLGKVTTNSIFALVIAVLCILRKDGKPILNFMQAAKGITWNPLLIVAAAVPIASALTNEATGIVPFVSMLLGPIFMNTSANLFCIIVLAVALILTNLGNNVAVGSLLIPIIVPFIEPLGINASALGAIMVFCVTFGIMTPGASAPGALIFGNEWFTMKTLYKYLTFSFILFFVLVVAIMLPLAQIMY